MSKWDFTVSGFICCDEYSDLAGVQRVWNRRQRGGKIADRSSVSAGKVHHLKVDMSCQGDSPQLFGLVFAGIVAFRTVFAGIVAFCMVLVGIVALLLLCGRYGN